MNYRQDIELFRIISAFGIIWFHSHLRGGDIGYSGLIYFIILSSYLSGNEQRALIYRSKRLLLPWLFWSLFYGFFNLLFDKPFIDTGNGFLAGFLTGSHIHLWYLPFTFLTLLLFDLIKNVFSAVTIGYTSAFIAIILLISIPLWGNFTNSLGAPWAQYLHALPAVFIGISFWAFNRLTLMSRMFIMLLLLFAAIYTFDISGVGIPYIFGILLFSPVLVLTPWLKLNFDIRKISSLTLGIYLLHPFIIMILLKFTLDFEYYTPLVVFICSIISIWLAKKLFPKLLLNII